MKFVEIESGRSCFELMEWDIRGWEAFDFPSRRWIPLESREAWVWHWAIPYFDPVDFDRAMREAVKDFPDDCIVIYYKDNESFGVLRNQNREQS